MSRFPLHLVVLPPPVQVETMTGVFLKYAPICLVLALVSPILIFYFIEQRKKELASGNDGADEEILHGGGASDVIDVSLSQTRKCKNEDDETSSSSKKACICRFCKQVFDNSQALGGHMNRHRRERENEKYLKAEDILAKRGNYNRGYQYGGAPTYMQTCPQGANAGGLYQGGAQGMSNGSMMGPPSRLAFQSISNQTEATQQLNPSLGNQSISNQAGAAQQLNPSFGNRQNVYQHGASSYSNQPANASQQSANGVAQPSYRPCTNSGKCSIHGLPPPSQPRSYSNPQPYIPYNSSSSSHFMQLQSNNALPSFLSQAAGVTGETGVTDATSVTATRDGRALRSHAQSEMHPSLQQSSSVNRGGALFVDLFGNSTPQAPLPVPAATPGYSTLLGPVAPQYDPAVTPQDQYAAHALYGTSVDGAVGAPSGDFFPYTAEALYQTLGENLEQRQSFQEALEGDEYGSVGSDPSTTAVQESSALGFGVGSSTPTDARSQR